MNLASHTYVRIHVHCENTGRPLIQSLALMRSAISKMPWLGLFFVVVVVMYVLTGNLNSEITAVYLCTIDCCVRNHTLA